MSPAVWAALGTVYLVWGATYLSLRILIETIPPLLGGTLRYLAPAALLAAFVVTRRGPGAFKISWRGLASTAVVGLLLLTGGNGMFPLAEQHISTGLTALIIAAVPLWLALLQAAAGDLPSARTFAGVVTGFGGVALLSLSGDRGTNGGLGIVIILGASLSWSVGSFLVPRLPMPPDALVALVYELTAGGLALIPIGLARGERLDLVHVSLRSWLALGYLVVFGTLIAFTSYSWLLRHAPLSVVGTYAWVNPVIAIALGSMVLGERITRVDLLGASAIITGVAIVVSSTARSPE